MVEFLCRIFVKSEDYQDDAVREKVGTMASFVGIGCNILLFVIKLSMGLLANSIAIISDAFNNLSDSASNLITLFGYKMAAKPADKDHPFGHGRMEYLTSLVIAGIILLVGFELMKGSADKILHPEKVNFSWLVLFSLLFSILLKFWMAYFNRQLGNRINSGVLLATAQDSLNDCIATSASAVALVMSLFVDLPVDGVIGCVVSIFILYSGYGIIRSTVDELLGKPADKELIQKIEDVILCNPIVIGTHDMIIHDYGPGKFLGSAHVEVDSSMDFMKAHDLIDELERLLYKELKIMMTLHMDPVDTNNESVQRCKKMMIEILSDIDESLSMHDFRIVTGPTHTNLIFDIVVPYECQLSNHEIQNKIDEQLQNRETVYYTVITFDRSFI